MAITEQSRHRLRLYLEETMGEEQASTMMDHLLPVSWTDLATSREVGELGAATTRELAELRTATTREFAAVRAEMTSEFAAVRAEMASEFAAVRGEIGHLREVMDLRWEQTATKAELAELGWSLTADLAEVRIELHKGLRRQTWGVVTAVSAINGLMLAALRFV